MKASICVYVRASSSSDSLTSQSYPYRGELDIFRGGAVYQIKHSLKQLHIINSKVHVYHNL